jgi:Thioesterase superfamily
VTPGTDEITVEMDLRPELCGPAGSLKGGVISTLVDVAGALSAVTVFQRLGATRDMSISFLAPARAGPVRAHAVPRGPRFAGRRGAHHRCGQRQPPGGGGVADEHGAIEIRADRERPGGRRATCCST